MGISAAVDVGEGPSQSNSQALERLNDREVTPPHQIAMAYSWEYLLPCLASLIDDDRMKTVMDGRKMKRSTVR